jgi:cyclopropane-fatty-acyl-phospholipid synthase
MTAMQEAGLEVRDVESLREHYTLTLRAWLANLAEHRAEAEADIGVGRERVWRMYMLGSALGFADADVTVYQVLTARAGAPHPLPLQRSLGVEEARCEGGRNHGRRGGLPHGALTG